jgi:hypothetical protein
MRRSSGAGAASGWHIGLGTTASFDGHGLTAPVRRGLERASARGGYGNLPEDSVYHQRNLDGRGEPLSSSRRYAIGDHARGLRRNADGSLNLAIQHDEPTDPPLRANWLPVGPGAFHLIMRSHDPEASIVNGSWTPAPVVTQR